MPAKKEYRIFYKDRTTNGKWVYPKFGTAHKTLEEAKNELYRLRRLEENNRKKKKGETLGIEYDYSEKYFTEYKIGVREVMPFEILDI